MILEFIIAVLAVWRLAYMIQNEPAPFNMFGHLRKFLRVKEHARKAPPEGGLRNLFDCFKCLSVWLAVPAAIWLVDGVFTIFITTMAIAGAAIFVQAYAESKGM